MTQAQVYYLSESLRRSGIEESKFNAALHGQKLLEPLTFEAPSKEVAKKAKATANNIYQDLLKKANGQRP